MNNDFAESNKSKRPNKITQEIYRTLFASIDEGFCIIEMIFDDNGKPVNYRFLETNAVFQEITGLIEPIGKTALELVPDLEPKWIEIYGNIALTGKSFRFIENSVPMNRWFDVYAMQVGGEESGMVAILFRNITEQKRREENLALMAEIQAELQTSEERYRALTEASAQVVWTMDADGKSDSHRHWFSQLTGQSIEEIKGKGYLNFVHPADCEELQNTWFQVMKKPVQYEVEFRLLTKENNYRYYNLRGVPLFNKDGTLREWIGTVKDINEKKEAQNYLERYRLLSEKAGDIVWMISPKGDIIEVNQAAVNTYGYTREDLLQMNLRDLRAPDTLSTLATHLDQAIEHGIKFETQHVCKDGTVIQVEVNANGATFGDERLIMGIVRNITERKKLEAQVQRQFEELETIYRTAPIGLALVDKNFRFLRINTRLAEINGVKAEDHIGQTIRKIVPDIADQAEMVFRKVFKTGEAVLNVEFEGETNAHPGIKRFWNESWYPVKNEKNETIAVSIIVEDITERKQADEKLKIANYRFQIAEIAATGFNYDWDLRTGKISRSASIERVTGYRRNELAQNWEAWANLIHPADLINQTESEAVQYIKNFKAEIFSSEYRIKHKGGQTIWVMERGLIVRDETREAIRIIGQIIDVTENKIVEEKLRESENRLQFALDSAKMGIHIWNILENSLQWDDRMRQLWGLEPDDEVNYETFIAGIHRNDLEKVQQAVDFALNQQNGGNFYCEYRIIEKTNGKLRWISATGQVHFVNEIPQRLIGTARDITIQKEAEATILAKDELLSRITNVTPTLLAHCSKDFRYLFVNQPLADFLGFRIDELIGKPIREIMGESAFNSILPHIEKVLSGERVEFENEILYSTAGRHYMHIVYVPEYDNQNNVIGWFATITDITERKESEKANQFLASIIESTDDAIISKDLDGIITSWNKSAEKMFGYQPEEIIGKSVMLLIPRNFQYQESIILQKLREGEGIHHYETKRQRKDGSLINVSLTNSPIRDKDGNVIGASKIVRDITERIEAEAELHEQQRFTQNIIEAAPSLTYIYDLEVQANVFISPQTVDLLGYTAQEIKEMKSEVLPNLTHPYDTAAVAERFKKILADTEDKIFELEYRMQRKDGNWVWLWSRDRIFRRNEEGTPIQILGVATDITERKESEMRLRETEERFSKAFNASPLVLTISSLETGVLTEVNETFVKVTGYSREETIGKTTIELGLWKNPADRESEMNLVREFGQLSDAEYVFQTKSGREIIGLLAAEKIEIGGKPFALTVIQDITERKRIEEKLLRSNEFHSIIAAISADWAFSARVEPDGKVITDAVTKGFTKQLGYKLEEMLENGDLESIIHPEDLPAAAKQMKKLMRGEVIRGKIRHLSKAGHTIVSEYQTIPVIDKNGNVIRIYGASRDITQQILSEQLIRDSESRLRTVIESATEYAIFTLKMDGIISSWSPGAEKIFGYSEGEIIGQKVDILFTPANREKNVPMKEMQMALTKGRAADDRYHLRKDGSRFFASGVMMPILKNGVAEGFVKIARDMTAQISAEKAVRDKVMLQKLVIAQENERQRIARDLHDELGQQLTALRLKLENATRICRDQKVKAEIDNIQFIARQIDNGVDFLAWELRPAVLDDLGLFAAFEKFISEWTNYSRVQAELLPSSLKGVRFSPNIETNLYRILQEALNNINKHAKATYTEIQLERRDDFLVLIISDDGIGFNPKTIRTQNKGIGLVGMTERAILIGGTLEIESTPGQGTTLYTKVPGVFEKNDSK